MKFSVPKSLWLTILLFFGFSVRVEAAEIGSTKTEFLAGKALCMVVLKGEVTAGDALRFNQALNRFRNKDKPAETSLDLRNCHDQQIEVLAESNGGDLDEAMAIGRIIRSHEMTVQVLESSTCASACTFVVFGGVKRVIKGRFGVHRPYGSNLNIEKASAEKSYVAISERVREYLQEMHIDPRVNQLMNNISPTQVRWLSFDELIDLNIFGADPVFEDMVLSYNASKLGLTKSKSVEIHEKAAKRCPELLKKEGLDFDNPHHRAKCVKNLASGRWK